MRSASDGLSGIVTSRHRIDISHTVPFKKRTVTTIGPLIRRKMQEFAINWIKGDKIASVTVPSSTALGNKILRLANERADVVIIRQNNDGSIYAKVPVKWIKLSPPREMTEEQRQQLAERMRGIKNASKVH